jgi:hypothetical protein
MGTICGANRLRSARQRLRKVLRSTNAGIQYVEYAKGDGAEMFEASANLVLRGLSQNG